MAIQQKLGLSARLSHRLILTPSLQQAIKLLPLTTLELAEVLEQEVMENPLLEEQPKEDGETSLEELEAQEKQAERDDPLKDIDVEKFFEEFADESEPRRARRNSATLIAFSLCWRILSGSVSSPWMNWKAFNGLMAAPRSRSNTARARRI